MAEDGEVVDWIKLSFTTHSLRCQRCKAVMPVPKTQDSLGDLTRAFSHKHQWCPKPQRRARCKS